MISNFSDLNSQGQKQARPIDIFPEWTVIHVQVFGANTLYLACSREELEKPLDQSGQQNGIPIVAGMGNQQLNWKGPLWGLGSAPGTIANIALPGRDKTGQ